MRCPYCRSDETRVLDSRSVEDGKGIRRRRECVNCNRRFTTYERVEELPLRVIKKDGRRELFDRDKLLAGVMKACEKRYATMDTLANMVDEIEQSIRDSNEAEVSSQTIGHMVMERLKQIDQVAYIRFASVYREFKDVGELLNCLEELQEEDQK